MESQDSHHRLVVNPDTLTEVLEKAAQRAGVQLPLPASRSEEHPIRYYERLSGEPESLPPDSTPGFFCQTGARGSQSKEKV